MVPALVALLVLVAAAPAAAHVPFAEELVDLAERRYPNDCQQVQIVQTGHVTRRGAVGESLRADGRCFVFLPRDPELHRWSLEELCHTIVHEMGHNAGLGHSTDPSSPMYPRRVRSSRPQECESLPIARWRTVRRAKRRAWARFRRCDRGYRFCVRRASAVCGRHLRMVCWRHIAGRVD